MGEKGNGAAPQSAAELIARARVVQHVEIGIDATNMQVLFQEKGMHGIVLPHPTLMPIPFANILGLCATVAQVMAAMAADAQQQMLAQAQVPPNGRIT